MIAILDFGSPYTELIARRIRELNVYSEILPPTTSLDTIRRDHRARGIILSGGPDSVFDPDFPKCDMQIFRGGFPVLGIGYGLHLMTMMCGGEVVRGEHADTAHTSLLIDNNFDLFDGLWLEMGVLMAGGDAVIRMPEGFQRLGHTPDYPIAAMGHISKRLYGLQFYPEVPETTRGLDMLRNFVYTICGCVPIWTPKSYIKTIVADMRQEVKSNGVLCALTGGVDSTTVALLMKEAFGDKLTCIFIDQGFMRKSESWRIRDLFRDLRVNLVIADARERFYKKIEGITDSDRKRKLIGDEFFKIFEEEAEKLKNDFSYLAIGTLYSDVIRNRTRTQPAPEEGGNATHNISILPDRLNFKLIEPLKRLFKEEVQQVALELNIPPEIVWRQPFPGPGLAIRVSGEVTPERIKLLQEADAILIEEIKRADLYHSFLQSFAVLLPVPLTSGKDTGSWANIIVIRAVVPDDGGGAKWAQIPYDVLDQVSSRILAELREVKRVVYDISNKPPVLVEWD